MMTSSLRMICLVVLTMAIASPVWADAGKSDTAKSASNDIVHPAHDLYRFHEWIMPLRIKYYDIDMAWQTIKVPRSIPLHEMMFKTDMIKTVDDYLALQMYFQETAYQDQGLFNHLLQRIHEMSKMQAMVRVIIEERARQGICDELLHYYDGAPFGRSPHYLPDFTAFFECVQRPESEWQGAHDTRIKLLKKLTIHLANRLNNSDVEKVHRVAFKHYMELKDMVLSSNDSQEILGIFFDLWENWAKEGLKPLRRSHEHLRKQAPELLKKHGPYPKPGWNEQIEKIHSKTMKEWEEYFRPLMGEDGLPLGKKIRKWRQEHIKRTKESEQLTKDKGTVPQTKDAPKVSEPEPTPESAGYPYMPWLYIAGILAILSALIVSVIVIRRRRN